MMTKRTQKLFRQWRKKNAGCIRGLMNFFYFRQGHSAKKLLSNKRCGSARNLGISNARNKINLPCKLEENHGDIESAFNLSDTESDEADRVNLRISSINTLVDKKMSRAHHSRKEFSSKIECIKAELGTGVTSDKNHKEATMNAVLSSDKKLNASPSLISQQSDHPDMSTMLSSDLDFNAFMLNYCTNFLEGKENPLEIKKMAGKAFKLHQNQLLGEHPEAKKLQKQNGHYILRKREKLTEVDHANESHDAKSLDRIVVLKPTRMRNQNLSNAIAPVGSISSHCGGTREGRDNLSSHFSLKEFRRRFRNAIGASRKVKHQIAMDGVLHKIPYGKQITSVTEKGGEKRLDAKAYEKKNAFSVASEITGRKSLSKNSAPRILYTEASFCNEARKHLTDFLRIGSENESLPPIHVSKTLGRILSFPGFNHLSPRRSPAREKVEFLQEKSSLPLCHSEGKNDTEHLEHFRHKESFPNVDNNLEAKNEIMEIIEIAEVCQLEARSVLISNENDLPSEAFKDEASSMLLEPEQSETRYEPSSPSTPTASKLSEIEGSNVMNCAMDVADRPSPISVLEPLLFEPINTPENMLSWRPKAPNAETQSQSRASQIDNPAAALCSTDAEEDLISCTEFNEALLFDELEVSYSMCIDDPKLLFDFIDEVLTEIKERHLGVTSSVSFIKSTMSPLHKHEYFMKEACRRINWHLNVPFPNTMDQSVKKDLDGTVWIDLHFGAENTVREIGESILDYIFEEIALDLLD